MLSPRSARICSFGQCQMQNAKCQMLNAKCQMLNAQWHLRVDRGAVRSVCRLSDRLRHRRMRVDRPDQFLHRALEPQSEGRFGDELRRTRTDHVNAENFVVLSFRDNLDESLRLAGDPRAAEN